MGTLAELLGNASTSTPWLVLAAGALLMVAAGIGRRLSRQLGTALGELRSSARHQGERIGDLEKDLGLENVRRRQLEYSLARAGISLPWWPDSPADDVDDDLAPGSHTAHLQTQYFVDPSRRTS